MTQRSEKLRKALDRLEEAVVKFKAIGCDESLHDMSRDSLIKRFEFVYELLWKSLKDFLEEQHGVIALSPRKVFQACVDLALVSFEEGKRCDELSELRNESTHTYDEPFAEDAAERIIDHVSFIRQLTTRFFS